MGKKMTLDLLMKLKEEGYTYLVADGQSSEDRYDFRPVKWDKKAFFNELLYFDFPEDAIFSIDDLIDGYDEFAAEGHEINIMTVVHNKTKPANGENAGLD